MSKKLKISIIFAVVTIMALILIMTVLPLLARNKAVAIIQDETGRKASIEKIAINPFTLTITINGFAVKAGDNGPFVSISSLRASFSLASIHKRALIFSEVSVDKPAFTFARLAANKYNFSDIIERQKGKPKKESSGETHFSINNITIKNGSVDFDDRAVNGGRKHTIRNLEIAVPFISNIPYLVEKYIDPRISVVVDNAPFGFNGKVKPFSKSMETSVHITLKQLSLPEFVAYAPIAPPVDLESGKLNIDTMVSYRVSSDKKPELGVKGMISLDNIGVKLKNDQPLLRVPKLMINASDLELFARRFILDAITVDGMELFLSRDAEGKWMYSRLLPQQAEVEKTVEVAKDKEPDNGKRGGQTLVRIAAFGFHNGIVHFNDNLPKGGFKGDITGIDAAVKNFSTAPDKPADYQLSLLLDKETAFKAGGAFAFTPLAATASVKLNGIKLQRGWPYLSRFLNSPVKGNIDIAAEVGYGKEKGLTVRQGTILATDLTARYGDRDGFASEALRDQRRGLFPYGK